MGRGVIAAATLLLVFSAGCGTNGETATEDRAANFAPADASGGPARSAKGNDLTVNPNASATIAQPGSKAGG